MGSTTYSDAVRVTQYHVRAGEFTGTTYSLTLRQNLVANYFVVLNGSDNVVGPTPDGAEVRVSADPFGTGGLSTSGAANTITLSRDDSTNDWIGTVTVYECLQPTSPDGFQLTDVLAISLAAGSDENEQVTTAYSTETLNDGAHVPFYTKQSSGSDAASWQGQQLHVAVSGTTAVSVSRYPVAAAGGGTGDIDNLADSGPTPAATTNGTDGGLAAGSLTGWDDFDDAEYTTIPMTGAETFVAGQTYSLAFSVWLDPTKATGTKQTIFSRDSAVGGLLLQTTNTATNTSLSFKGYRQGGAIAKGQAAGGFTPGVTHWCFCIWQHEQASGEFSIYRIKEGDTADVTDNQGSTTTAVASTEAGHWLGRANTAGLSADGWRVGKVLLLPAGLTLLQRENIATGVTYYDASASFRYDGRNLATPDGSDLAAGTVTAHLVKWGTAWTMQTVDTTDTTGGADSGNNKIIHGTAALTSAVDTDRTFVMASGYEDQLNGSLGWSVALGDGLTVNASESTVAVGSAVAPSTRKMRAYVLSHPKLRVGHTFTDLSASWGPRTVRVNDSIEPEFYGADNPDVTAGFRGVLYYIASASDLSASMDRLIMGEHRYEASDNLQMSRKTDTGSLQGWVQSVDFAAVQAEISTGDGSRFPGQYMVFPDHKWDSSLLSSSSSEDGRWAGEVTRRSGTDGGLRPYQSGAVTAGMTLVYGLSVSGGADNAYWTWRDQADSEWQGWDHWTMWHGAHSWNKTATNAKYGFSACYSKTYDKLVGVQWTHVGQVFACRSRKMDEGQQDYTNEDVTISIPNGLTNVSGRIAVSDVVELPDGSLRWFLRENIGAGPTSNDIMMYSSEDGGATWKNRTRRIVQEAKRRSGGTIAHTAGDCTRIRAAVSGDWIRLVWHDGGDDALYTLVSSDRGATWASPGGDTNGLAVNDNGDAVDEAAWAVTGTDSGDGAFILWADTGGTAGETLTGYTASRDADWSAQSSLDVSYNGFADVTVDIKRAAAVSGTDFVWLVFYYEHSDASPNTDVPNSDEGFGIVLFDRFDPADSNLKVDFASASARFLGPIYTGHTIDFKPALMRLHDCGRGIVMTGNNLENDGSDYKDGSFVLDIAGWSRYPNQVSTDAGEGDLETHVSQMYWFVPFGSPIASSASAWYNQNNSTTVSWNAQRLQMSDSTAGNYNTLEHVSEGSTSGDYIGGMSGGAQLRVTASQSTATSTTVNDVGIEVKASDASVGWHYFIAVTSTMISVIDMVANSTLTYLSTPDMANDFHRIQFAANASNQVYVYAQNVEDPWSSRVKWEGMIGPATLTTSASITMDAVTWGHFANSAGETNTSEWQSFRISTKQALDASDGDDTGQIAGEVTNPTGFVGKRTSSLPAALKNGLKVRWAGGGGFNGDLFNGYMRHDHQMENVISVDSPRYYWQAASDSAEHLTFNYGANQRSHHEALCLFGTRTRKAIIEYNHTDSWGSPAATYECDATLVTGLTVDAITGDMVTLDDAVANISLKKGVYADLFIQATTGSAAGKAWRITGHPGRATMQLDSDTASAALTAEGLATGDHVVIYGDRMSVRYASARKFQYFRVLFPALTTDTGKHRLGTIVAGPVKEFDVPLDWSWRNNWQPNTTRFRTKSSITWNFAEGPGARVLSGRLVGDVNRWREEYNYMQNHLTEFDVKPLAVFLDDLSTARSLHLAYVTSGGDMDNDGWYLDDDGTWREAGDQTIDFEECV